uniref:Si:ch73-132f6.5 n=1 Tax=Kryptolebias marmoratus TaxID=37003 RepID=A0A3Q3ATB5_KRYMA
MPHRKLLSEVKMADGGSRRSLPKTLHSMNAYLGAEPIRRCLDLGADVVVTGRCVDSAVALGPLMHAFGWKRSDYDLLAAGSLAGHLIECGAQSTGGIFTDWHHVPDWDNMGFPVVQCSPDGSFVLSKPAGTGGLVSFGTAAEQLVYEIGDPRRYLLPDVTCDFSQVKIQEVLGVEGGAVRVHGSKGSPPTHDYKVCATYMDGFRATAVCPVGGPRAAEKARRTAESILKRTKRMFHQFGLEDFHSVHVQVLGAEDTYGPNARCKDSREVVIWMAVRHKQKKALEIFAREVAPAGTGMAPGLTGIVGGRPKVSPVLKPFFFLHPKSQLKVDIHMGGELLETLSEAGPDTPEQDEAPPTSDEDVPDTDLPSGPHTYRLQDLAYTRSGDKGDSANIGEKKKKAANRKCCLTDTQVSSLCRSHRSSSSVLPLPEATPDFFCGGGILLPPDRAGPEPPRHQIHSAGDPRPQLRPEEVSGRGRGGLAAQRPAGESLRTDAAGPGAQGTAGPQVSGGLRLGHGNGDAETPPCRSPDDQKASFYWRCFYPSCSARG